MARVVHDLAAAATVGLLILAVWAIPPPPGAGRSPRVLAGAQMRAVRAAAAAGVVWVVAGAVGAVASYATLTGLRTDAPGFGAGLTQYLLTFDQGRAQAASLLLAFAATTGALLVTRCAGAGLSAVLALAALLPLSLTGHAAGTDNHGTAVTSLAVHLVAATIWIGGLVGLLLVRPALSAPGFASTVRRFSGLAGWCWAAVAVSGLVNALTRVDVAVVLGSDYGLLLAGKTAALALLGAAGWWHRRRLLQSLDGVEPRARAAFRRLAVGEVLLMGATVGLAVALARTSPPASGGSGGRSTAEALLGYPPPPPVTAARWASEWRLDLLWFAVATALLIVYVVGVLRLRRRGDRWPLGRMVAWSSGCLLLVWATNGAPGAYSSVSFSMHMVGHMMLSMVIPPLLVLGAPATLALRSLSRRSDGSRGAREWLLAVLHSRPLAVLAHPIVAAVAFSASLIAFYYSPLFELALRTHTGHALMTAHFLLVGYLFAAVMIGVDPGPARPAHPLRLLLLLATLAFHAFFGVALLGGETLLAGDWFAAVTGATDQALLDDQQDGGAIAWALGDLPAIILVLGVAWSWMTTDEREARRYDRQAERDGDAALAAHNARLRRLHQGPQQR